MIGQQCRYYCGHRYLRVCNKQAVIIIQNAASLLHPRSQQQHKSTPWAWEGISAVYQSSQSVTEDSQSWGCGSIYPGYTASTITNRHESKAIITRSLHGVHLSVGVLGAACNSVVTTESFMLPFAYLCTRPSPHSVSAVRGARPGLVLACMLPIPF